MVFNLGLSVSSCFCVTSFCGICTWNQLVYRESQILCSGCSANKRSFQRIVGYG